MYYSGIDLHRRSLVICTVDENGTVVDRKKMKKDASAVISYFQKWPGDHKAALG